MKLKSLIIFIFFIGMLSSFQIADTKIALFTNNYKTEVTEGMYINCLTINDLSAVMPITEKMYSFDILKLELHRFGNDADIVAASKKFDPKSKEFKKNASKGALKIKILAEEAEFNGSDLEPNTLAFPAASTVNMVFCKSHDLKYCSFYLILRGYKKTGAKSQFNEDVFDEGRDLSAKSAVFKSWH